MYFNVRRNLGLLDSTAVIVSRVLRIDDQTAAGDTDVSCLAGTFFDAKCVLWQSGYCHLKSNTLKLSWWHTPAMGALDKRVVSGVSFVSALLFIVSAVMLFTGDKSLTSDDCSTALYITTIAGILAIVYSALMIIGGDSFVRKLAGIVIALAGLLFMAVKFSGGSAETIIAIAGLLAGLGIVLDMLALWVSRVYGAMYVSAVLAAVDIAMGAMCLIRGYDQLYVFVMLIVFAAWLIVSGCVNVLVKAEASKKTREVVEGARAQKKEKPQAQNKKATPKAKKSEPKTKPAEVPEKTEEPKKVRTVELPKTPSAMAAIEKTQAEAAAKEQPKQEQKAPAKAMGDFMQKLMSSQDASRVAVKKEEPAPATVVKEQPKPTAVAEKTPAPIETPAEKPVEESAEEPEVPAPKFEAAEPEEDEEELVAAPEVPKVTTEVPEVSVISEPIVDEKDEFSEVFHTPEPNWAKVTQDSSETKEETVIEKKVEPVQEQEIPAPVEEPEVPAPAEEEEIPAPTEELEIAEPVQEQEIPAPVEEPEVPAPAEEEEIPAPAEEPEIAEPVDEPEVPAPAEEEEIPAPAEEPVKPAAVTTEVPETSVISEPIADAGDKDASASEPAPNWDVVSRDADSEQATEDIYTDNSPEALVRRAAWNKGLRCRRGYGELNIPVAFVKGKVAVYVDEPGADTSSDEILRSEGWTVLRYNAADITDGKAQGEEIAAAVKENTKATKKKKAKK